MLFNSLQYLLFFPIVTVCYFLVPSGWTWALLLAASYYFYMCAGPVYALLLAYVTLVSFGAGLAFSRYGTSRERRRRILMWAVPASVGGLVFFKYMDFASAAIEDMVSLLGLQLPLGRLHLLLPVGLSFFTFQALSYVLDVSAGKKEPETHLGIYALYVSFFPQLVAGPIERSTRLIPQLKENHGFEYKRVRDGLIFMLFGFFKKVVVADRCALVVDRVFSSPGDFSGLSLMLAAYLFALQIYCDFSGYTDIALGSARVMGFNLMENFKRPYMARSVAEFWNRWHISLYTWFRDYIYIPLSGSRGPASKTHLNILLVFFISGLWHGAAYTFVAWGLLHGLCIVVSRATSGARNRFASALGLSSQSKVREFLAVLFTFHLITALWVLFRSKTIPETVDFFSRMVTEFKIHMPLELSPRTDLLILFLLGTAILLEHIFGWTKWKLISPETPSRVRWTTASALLWAVVFLGVFNNTQFIYFVF